MPDPPSYEKPLHKWRFFRIYLALAGSIASVVRLVLDLTR